MSGLTKVGDILAPLLARAEARNGPKEGDYISPDDGLLYCGKCHTPKQCRVEVPDVVAGKKGEIITAYVLCKCELEKREAEERLEQERRELEIVDQLKQRSLMDERFKAQTFESFKTTKHNGRQLKICRRYAETFSDRLAENQGLLFYGDVGTGKTFAAACIANYLLERRVPVVMTSFVKLLGGMGFGEDEEKLIAQLNRPKLLVIDDLGAERGTEYALERVYNVIDSRYRTGMPMIVTTNLELREMQEASDRAHKRIYDRVFEGCYPVQFTGPSLRKVEAKRRWDSMKSILEAEDEPT